MQKKLIIVIAVCIIIAAALGLCFLPIPHHVNNVIEGRIIYKNGSEINCSVTIDGRYKHYLFREDLFDGSISVNGASIFMDSIYGMRIVFGKETGQTGYTSSELNKDKNGTVLKTGDILLNQQCNTVVISCCYDNTNNSETADEAYRCLIIAPAKNSDDAKKIITSYDKIGLLEKFDIWNF
jgi:hypothetical protein